MSLIYVIIGILFFGVLIAIHEFGHFICAKFSGVRVEEFAIGMGPALLQKQKGETKYSLRLIPFGGYCAMTGEDGESSDERAFVNQRLWKKLAILLAGPFMNFVLGLVIILILYAGSSAFLTPTVGGFMEGCPYSGEEGIQVGDRFYSVDGHRTYMYYDVADYLDAGNGRHEIVLVRNGGKVTLEDFEMVRIHYEGYSDLKYGFFFGYEEATLESTLRFTWDTAMEFGRWVWQGLGQLTHGEAKVTDMSGPVGIVDMMAETGTNAESFTDGLFEIFYLGAFIAVNLAMMNLLPIPALDGGRIFLILVTFVIEKLIGRKLNPKYELVINSIGLVLLLGLMAFVMFNDILKLVINS